MEKTPRRISIRRIDSSDDDQSEAAANNVSQKSEDEDILSQTEVVTILKRYIREAEESYDQFTKSQLARARKQLRSRASSELNSLQHFLEPKDENKNFEARSNIGSASPFVEVSEQTDYMSTRSKKRHTFALSSCSDNSIVTRHTLNVEVIKYGNDGVDVPGHTFHVQLRSNLVTENNNKLNFNPNELQFDDPQWSLEEYEDELKDHFTGGLLEERAKPLRYAERAKYLRPFMFRALREINCSTDSIVRHFIDLDSESRTKREEHNPRKREYALPNYNVQSVKLLGDSALCTKDEQHRARTFCFAFEKLLKFSAWYLVEDIFSKTRAGSFAAVESHCGMCRICFRYLCTAHGEFKDGDERAVKKRKTARDHSAIPNIRKGIIMQSPRNDSDHREKRSLDLTKQHYSYKTWRKSLKIYESLKDNLPVNYARGQFYPCNHSGSCKDNECRCFRAGVNCEKFCGCADDCRRRFRGCDCARRDLPCSPKGQCVCRMMDRECDPDLCESCGASSLLDPSNSDDDASTVTVCSNVGIQKGIPRRMLLGSSQVSGFGLFMGEEAHEGDFLAEYKGELISKSEASRRQILHQYLREYLFVLNRDQQIDGLHAGNKLRFINNSCRAENINCDPIPMFCNGVVRMGLFATRTLHPGDELFFNYGYTEEQMEDYQELPAKLGTLSKSAGHAPRVPDKTNIGTLKGLMSSRLPMTAAPPASRPSPLAVRIIADSDDGLDDNALESESS